MVFPCFTGQEELFIQVDVWVCLAISGRNARLAGGFFGAGAALKRGKGDEGWRVGVRSQFERGFDDHVRLPVVIEVEKQFRCSHNFFCFFDAGNNGFGELETGRQDVEP